MTKISLTFIAAALVPIWSWAQGPSGTDNYDYGSHMMGWGWGGGWFGMILGPLFMILVLAVVIAVAALLVRWITGSWQGSLPPQQPPLDRTPLDILKERYARGDIDKEEFEERRSVIAD